MPRLSRAHYAATRKRGLVIRYLKIRYVENPTGWVTMREIADDTGLKARHTHSCLTGLVQSQLVEKRAKVRKQDWNAFRLTDDGLAYPASQYKETA